MKKYYKILLLISISFFPLNSSYSADRFDVIAGYLCIDFKPFFPIGVYSFPERRNDDAIWQEAANAGFNFTLFNGAGKYGIFTSPRTPFIEKDGKRRPLMNLNGDDGSMLKSLKEFIGKYENEPTVICWHAPDEPAWFGPAAEELELGYKAIKSISKKPVWLNIGPQYSKNTINFSSLRAYLQTCDIFSEDIYPVPDGKRKQGQGNNIYLYQVGEDTRQIVENASIEGIRQKAVWMVLQGFGWETLRENAGYKPPTKHELRYMTYDAIINGATGIIYWGVHTLKSDSQYWQVLKNMASELKSIYDVLSSTAKLEWSFFKVDNINIGILIKRTANHVYIFAANTRNIPVHNVGFSLSRNPGLSDIEVLFENRKINPNEDKTWRKFCSWS